MTIDQVKPARQLADERNVDGRREYTVTPGGQEFGVSRPTLYRALEPQQT